MKSWQKAEKKDTKERKSLWYQANKSRISPLRKIYYQENKERILAQDKIRRANLHKKGLCKNGDKNLIAGSHSYCTQCIQRANSLSYIRNYGITLKEKEEMILKQNSRCLICKKEFTTSRECHVDHNHSTGKIRGILCDHCNYMIGHAFDNVDILQNAINYLQI